MTTDLIDLTGYNEQQQTALRGILAWAGDTSGLGLQRLALLKGYAGTGKTYCMKALIKHFRSRIVFTAPTNKATKVLRDTLASDVYRAECRTIYSLLGLQLSADGEVRELRQTNDKRKLDLTQFKIIVVDEGSMIPPMLLDIIESTAAAQNLKFLFLADAAQLPPVKEAMSPIFKRVELQWALTQVMRHDNAILTLATDIRNKVDHPAPSIRLLASNDGAEGIWKPATYEAFAKEIRTAAHMGLFQTANHSKAIAWRNVTVDQLNALIRSTIFESVQSPWVESDRVIFTEPAKNLDDEIIATIDDEGLVTHVSEGWHPTWPEYKVFEVSVALDYGTPVLARVLHPDSRNRFDAKLAELGREARLRSREWPKFWEFKEAFHALRHAYAITAHRSQGSTYKQTFVYAADILANFRRNEAFRCLYVACTRASQKEIIL